MIRGAEGYFYAQLGFDKLLIEVTSMKIQGICLQFNGTYSY